MLQSVQSQLEGGRCIFLDRTGTLHAHRQQPTRRFASILVAVGRGPLTRAKVHMTMSMLPNFMRSSICTNSFRRCYARAVSTIITAAFYPQAPTSTLWVIAEALMGTFFQYVLQSSYSTALEPLHVSNCTCV